MLVLKEALAEYLKEDIGCGDVTSMILPDVQAKGEIICKQKGIVAGLNEIDTLFELMECKTKNLVKEGSIIKPNSTIVSIEGNAKAILATERTALNVLMRMSGIATETKCFIDEIKKINCNVGIACTRKTSPGFRIFDKRAVKIGGGLTHRVRLDEMILIKDNHLVIMDSVHAAVKKAREIRRGRTRIEVEIRNLGEAVEAIEAGADMIMLDNLTPKQVRSIVNALKKNRLRNNVLIEVSGGITHRNVKLYASIDIDIISIGGLTNSVKAIDMSLEIQQT